MKHYYRIIRQETPKDPDIEYYYFSQYCTYYFFGLIPIWRNISSRAWLMMESCEIEINKHRDEN